MPPSIFDPLGTPGAEPLRRTGNVRLTRDSDGNLVMQPVDLESIVMSPDGSVDQVKLAVDCFYHCGHSAAEPIGVKCAVPGCNRVSCQHCAARCEACLKPLCVEHVYRLVVERSREMRLCSDCRDPLSRRLRWQTIGRTLLKPFISFESEDSK